MFLSMEANSESEWIPRLGMEFESDEEGWEFWKKYGEKIGFTSRKHYTNCSHIDGRITSRGFVCSNEGFRKKDKRDDQTLQPRHETRTGCMVRFVLKLNRKSNKYEVTEVAACDIDLADASGIRPKATYTLMGRQVGGLQSLGHTLLDQNNYLRNKQKRALIHGEAVGILRYFCRQVSNNPSFQHEEQVDDQQEISNIFWADAQMVIDYVQFGDVVIFDTTHGTNKEHRPFGVFLGLNHFRETVIFGSVLLYDQTIESFEWVFKSFLKAHNNKKPKTIFTDQDAAMGIAIDNVMPETTHGLCTWHISENATKNLMRYGKDIVKEFKVCLFRLEGETDFEKSFSDLESKVGGTWLPFIYKSKKKWAYCYMKNVFSLGIRSTQLSESMNNFLKGYLKSDMNIVRFFEQFDRVVADKREKEVVSEYEYRKKVPRVKMKVPILLQVSERYTPKVFNVFQTEYEMAMAAQVECLVADEYIVTISDVISVEEDSSKCGRVFWNQMDKTVSCSCKKFERWGVLCSHALKVLDTMNIKLLPEKYVLKRWTREIRDGVVYDRNGMEVSNPKLDDTRRNRELCRKFTKISAKAASSKELYVFLDGALDNLDKQVDRKMLTVPNTISENFDISPKLDHMDNLPQKKGSLKKKYDQKGGKRHESWLEKLPKKKKKTTNNKQSKLENISSSVVSNISSMVTDSCNLTAQVNHKEPSHTTFINLLMNSPSHLLTLPSNILEDANVNQNSCFKKNTNKC